MEVVMKKLNLGLANYGRRPEITTENFCEEFVAMIDANGVVWPLLKMVVDGSKVLIVLQKVA